MVGAYMNVIQGMLAVITGTCVFHARPITCPNIDYSHHSGAAHGSHQDPRKAMQAELTMRTTYLLDCLVSLFRPVLIGPILLVTLYAKPGLVLGFEDSIRVSYHGSVNHQRYSLCQAYRIDFYYRLG